MRFGNDIKQFLTLDWDYYNLKYLELMKEVIQADVEQIAGKILVLYGQHGVNIVIKFAQEHPLDIPEHFHMRLLLGDDLFRIRNDLLKLALSSSEGYDEARKRINRIWIIKNGYEKKQEEVEPSRFSKYFEKKIIPYLQKLKKGGKSE